MADDDDLSDESYPLVREKEFLRLKNHFVLCLYRRNTVRARKSLTLIWRTSIITARH